VLAKSVRAKEWLCKIDAKLSEPNLVLPGEMQVEVRA
jgi:hypothetical protein